nr:LysR family transcriptional regulator [uncultured Cardiobacterium sp.]
MPDFNDMTLFVAVAEALSFSRAAEKLHLPQSTLSRRISALEKALGLQLLQRTTRRIELTEAGRHFYERARTIGEEAARLFAEPDGNPQQPAGLLRLSLPVDFAYRWLAPRLPAFTARYPAIRLQLDVSPQRVDLFRDPVDAVIRAGEPLDERLIARPLMHLPRYLYAAPPISPRTRKCHSPPTSPATAARVFRRKKAGRCTTPTAAAQPSPLTRPAVPTAPACCNASPSPAWASSSCPTGRQTASPSTP